MLFRCCLQSLYRGKSQRKVYKANRAACVRLQAWVRAKLSKRRYKRYLRAVVRLQANFKRIVFQRRHTNIVEGRRKWRGVLEPTEVVILQSLVRKRRDKGGMFKQDRRRQLLLTTKPRILYLDPESSVPTIKGQVGRSGERCG